MWLVMGVNVIVGASAVAALWRRTEHPMVTYRLGIVEGERLATERRKGERRGRGDVSDIHALR